MSSYITLSELKNTLELIGFNFADYDGQAAIEAASRGIDEFAGRRFYPNPSTAGTYITRYYSPYGQACITIDDLITVATVATDTNGSGVYDQVWTSADYMLEPLNAPADGRPYEELNRRTYGSKLFPAWPGSLAITGQWGWTETPAPVKQATTIMATRLLRRAREAPFGVVGLGLEGAAVRISRLDPDVAFLLNPFVKGGGALAA